MTCTDPVEVSVLMPCLDEAETVATCVRRARRFLTEHDIDGEVVVADNGSTDGSQDLASEAGARVVPITERGYGYALRGGIDEARGRYVIMGDADDSYDFAALMPFVERLRNGADLVMGNRFRGGIAPGAMPPLHRYLGNPVLSFIGRLFFRAPVGDFHCGLRGIRRESALALGLQSGGMEFASEMVVKAALAGQRIEEVPTTLSPDGRSRPPHLRSWRDGWRHLLFLLLFSPRWLFLIPGLSLFALGLVASLMLAPGRAGSYDLNVLAGASSLIVIGFQSVLFALLTRIYATRQGLLPEQARVSRLLSVWNLERILVAGCVLALASLGGLVFSWVYGRQLGLAVPSATVLVLSCQLILSAFFLGILGIRRAWHPVMAGARGAAPAAGPAACANCAAPLVPAQAAPAELADA
jgi:glycosyltransferase involved in cell wall biosynthesis